MLVSSTVTAILISEVEIMPMLMPASPRALNMVAATPEWERMPMPTADNFAMPPSVSILASGLSAASTGLSAAWALPRSFECIVNECRARPSLAMFETIMSRLISASPSAPRILPDMPGTSGMPVMVTRAWERSMETPRMTTFSMAGCSSSTSVPGLSLRDERTSKTTPYFLANSTDRDCMTFEPDEAISSISS